MDVLLGSPGRSTLEYYCTTTLDMVRLRSWWSRVLLYNVFGIGTTWNLRVSSIIVQRLWTMDADAATGDTGRQSSNRSFIKRCSCLLPFVNLFVHKNRILFEPGPRKQ